MSSTAPNRGIANPVPQRRVLKWAVPIDDNDHPIGAGPVVLVGVQDSTVAVVQVWTDESDAASAGATRRARVYGTGQPVPLEDAHLGSVIAGPFVWHVYAGRTPSETVRR